MGVELGRCQDIAAFRGEIGHALIEGDEVDGNIPLAHDAPGVASAAGGTALDDLNVIETEDRTGVAVTEG